MDNSLVFVDRDTAAWDQVWALLAASTGGDTAQQCRCCGERWQYMGSFTDGTTTAHEFRHRHCPTTRQREYRRFSTKADGPALELRPLAELLSPAAQMLMGLLTASKGGQR